MLLHVVACFLFLGTITSAQDACWDAYEACDWDFIDTPPGLSRFRLVTPDVPFTPRIVSKNPKVTIGILNSNNAIPEFILKNGEARPITAFGNPRLTPTHFKPLPIPQVMGSGVAFQTVQGNQQRVLKRRCVRLQFTSYQLLMGGNPPTVANIEAPPDSSKCVVFVTMSSG